MTETRNLQQQDIENDIVHYADKLRAGLLDDDPELKAKVRAVLTASPGSDGLWPRVRNELQHPTVQASGVSHELRARRREVLYGSRRKQTQRPVWPRLAAATAFAAVLVVGAAWWIGRDLLGPVAPSAEEVALPGDPELEQLNANLDFYAWLDHHQTTAANPR